MNLKHLGDALDHWKGRMFELLGDALHDLHVLPMFTDGDRWSEGEVRLYARLLGVSPEHILRPNEPFVAGRRGPYFSSLPLKPEWDVFVDPDTGFASETSGDVRHIRAKELAELLLPASSRVVLLYQHASRKRDHVNHGLQRITGAAPLRGCSAFAYDAGSVSMIFVSRRGERVLQLRDRLVTLLEYTPRVTKMHGAPPFGL